MSANPARPGSKPELTEEEKAILDERLKTADQDAKFAVDAKQAVAEIRRQLKHARPH